MAAKFFDDTVLGGASEALDFIGNILESSTEYSIIGKDLDGKILLWNEGARRMYGYEAEEVVGKAKSAILHTPEDVASGKPREMMDAAVTHDSLMVGHRLAVVHHPGTEAQAPQGRGA
jgi:PAS domain S-box-containing protein